MDEASSINLINKFINKESLRHIPGQLRHREDKSL